MQTIIIENCTVELHIPDMLEMHGMYWPIKEPRVKLTTRAYIHDVQVKMPDGKVVNIKKLLLRDVCGVMMPMVDENNNVVLFTVSVDGDGNVSTSPVEPDAVVGG